MAAVHADILNMLKAFRRHLSSLPNCERTALCGADSMLRILQLAMAEVNKRNGGEFTVSLSDALATWKYFLYNKLGLVHDLEEPADYAAIRVAYDAFLMSSNMLDLIDVHVKSAALESERQTVSLLPVQILDFISSESPHSEEQDLILSTISTPSNRPSQDNRKLQLALKRILCAYLSLLVNSKNDLALATTLNVPDRGLGREAFTDLKHAARNKQMSLFLVATSFVRTIELGGKGYAPLQSDPLRKHMKGLASFVSFIDKLDEMLGEIADPSVAVGRILSTLKMSLIRGRSSGDRYCVAVVDVVEDLELRIRNIINIQRSGVSECNGVSPARPKQHAINHGTASGGRGALKALLMLLDEEAAEAPVGKKADILCGDLEDASIPGAESMLSLFRSPEPTDEASPKSLRQRVEQSIKEKQSKLKQTLIRSQFACTYKDDHIINRKQPDFPSMSQVPTCIHPAPKLVSVLCFDEEPLAEETSFGPMAALGLVSGNVHPKKNESKAHSARQQSKRSKRKTVQQNSENVDCENQPPPKKTGGPKTKTQQMTKPNKSTAMNGSKAAPKNKLIAGQGKLTSFFRL